MYSLLMTSDQIQIENFNQREIKLRISSYNFKNRGKRKHGWSKSFSENLEKTPKESKKCKISSSIAQGKLLEEMLKN